LLKKQLKLLKKTIFFVLIRIIIFALSASSAVRFSMLV